MLWLLLIFMPLVAEAQWDQHVLLTNDAYTHYWAQVIVDSMYQVHLFDVRTLNPGPFSHPTSLFYQRFTNWGQPLSEAVDIGPGGGQDSYALQPGLFLDSHGSIHVAYSYPAGPGPRFYYCRLNLNGDIVTPPYPVAPDNPYFFDLYSNINMCETSDGRIWIACDQYYFVVSQDGQIVVSLQPVVTPYSRAMSAHIQSTTDDQVWAAIRYFGHPDYPQIAAVVRVDIPGQVPEVVSAPDSGQLMQMGPFDFFIDHGNAFHYLIGREDVGDFYQRDPRDGGQIDTVIIEPEPYGSMNTRFTLVGGDTLTYMWDRALPEPTKFRIGIHLAGERAYGPTVIPESGSGFTHAQQFQWRGGGYWIGGTAAGSQEFVWQSAVVHVPGNEEPSNASPGTRPVGTDMKISLFPNPVVRSAFVMLPGVRAPFLVADVYNILGQRVQATVLGQNASDLYAFRLEPGLSSGRYFLHIGHRGNTVVLPFQYLK